MLTTLVLGILVIIVAAIDYLLAAHLHDGSGQLSRKR